MSIVAEVAHDLVAHGLDFRLEGHVVGVVVGLAAHGPDPVADLLGGFAPGVATDGDISPGMGQGQCDGPSNSPRTSGNKRVLPREAEIRYFRLKI